MRIPEWPAAPATAPSNVPNYVLDKFRTQATLKDMSLPTKQKLLNYLGYSVPLDIVATALPTTLPISATPHLAMGGSIHSFPVQMTYSGTLDASGNLTSARSQSILYGTMEGGYILSIAAQVWSKWYFYLLNCLGIPLHQKL